MTLVQSQQTFTTLMAMFIIKVHGNTDYRLTMGEVFRHDFTQEHYLKKGLSKIKRSPHQDRLAFDINAFLDGKFLTKTEDYKQLGEIWKSLHPNCEWGGDWKSFPDGNHFQFKHLTND